jgi:hypothetical protein
MYLGEHDMAKKHFSQALNFDPDFKVAKEAFNSLKALERAKKSAFRALEDGGRPPLLRRPAELLPQRVPHRRHTACLPAK